jgi:hypothetical protein
LPESDVHLYALQNKERVKGFKAMKKDWLPQGDVHSYEELRKKEKV